MRTVKIAVSAPMLHHLLQLPDDVEIRGLYHDFDTNSIYIRVGNDNFIDTKIVEGDIIEDPWVAPELGPDGFTLDWNFPKEEK